MGNEQRHIQEIAPDDESRAAKPAASPGIDTASRDAGESGRRWLINVGDEGRDAQESKGGDDGTQEVLEEHGVEGGHDDSRVGKGGEASVAEPRETEDDPGQVSLDVVSEITHETAGEARAGDLTASSISPTRVRRPDES